jgi:hypothetical protein
MTVRLIVALALASLALVGFLVAVFRPPNRSLVVSTVIVIVAVVVLAVNEYVRSDGRFAI